MKKMKVARQRALLENFVFIYLFLLLKQKQKHIVSFSWRPLGAFDVTEVFELFTPETCHRDERH